MNASADSIIAMISTVIPEGRASKGKSGFGNSKNKKEAIDSQRGMKRRHEGRKEKSGSSSSLLLLPRCLVYLKS